MRWAKREDTAVELVDKTVVFKATQKDNFLSVLMMKRDVV